MIEQTAQIDHETSEVYPPPFATITATAIEFSRVLPMLEMKARYVFAVVVACKGNRTEAAKLLGISRGAVLAQLATARKLGVGSI